MTRHKNIRSPRLSPTKLPAWLNDAFEVGEIYAMNGEPIMASPYRGMTKELNLAFIKGYTQGLKNLGQDTEQVLKALTPPKK